MRADALSLRSSEGGARKDLTLEEHAQDHLVSCSMNQTSSRAAENRYSFRWVRALKSRASFGLRLPPRRRGAADSDRVYA